MSTGSAGTITQWIATCNCGIPTETQDEVLEVIEMCAGCGKRMNAGRSGTFTQWIFRLDLCSCETPVPVQKSIEELEPVELPEPEEDNFLESDEDALEVDPEKFPLDRYKPVEILGKGSSGTVYLAWDRLLNKKIAVKTLHTLEEIQQVYFQREAKATSKLNHENIVQVLDFGVTSSGIPFMAMEFVDGKSLLDLVEEKGALSELETIELFETVCGALGHAHSKGILHRDIKSSNLLLHSNAERKFNSRIIDFGVAAFQNKQEQADSQSKTMVGSPAYMPPDTALGLDYDERSEVYGVGCTLFEALTGDTPFTSDSSLETIRQHAHEPAPLISQRRDDIEFSTELVSLVNKCLSKDPSDRFQSMAELKEELLSIRDLLTEEVKVEEPQRTIEWKKLKNITRVPKKVLVPLFLSIFVIGSTVMVMTIQKSEKQEPNVVEEELPLTSLTDVISEAVEPHFREQKLPQNMRQLVSRGDVTNSELVELKGRTDIKTLIIPGTQIDDSGLQHLRGIPIENLYVRSQPITDRSIKTFQKVKGLSGLDIAMTKITNTGFQNIVDSFELSYLAIGGKKVDDKSIKIVSQMKSLTGLKLQKVSRLSKNGLSALASLPKLNKLEMSGCKFKEGTLDTLYNTKIKSMSFSWDSKIDKRDLKVLARMKPTGLGFSHCRITYAGIEQISKTKSLTTLNFFDCALTDKQVKLITKLPKLKSLDLRDNKITSVGVSYLRKAKQLEKLDLRGCPGVTGKDILALESSLKGCKILQLTGRQKDNEAFAEVTNSLLESTNEFRKRSKKVWTLH